MKKALGPAEKREAVKFLVDNSRPSISRSCRCVGLSRAAYYRASVPADIRDADIISALNEFVDERSNRGFWKCHKILRRRGHRWNHKRVHRVCCAMRLNKPRRANKRLPIRERQPLIAPAAPNRVWSADFVSDALYCGRRFRTLNVIDDFNREVVHIEIDTSLTALRLIRVIEQIKAERGFSQTLRVDNGAEFLGEVFTTWAEENGMSIQYIQSGKPNQNAYIERFNWTYRDEVLDLYLFRDLEEVREATHWWLIAYNEERPHDSLNDYTPVEYRNHAGGCV